MKKKYLIVCSIAILQYDIASSASFDCSMAKTTIEKSICSDKNLSAKDGYMGHLYKNYLNSIQNGDTHDEKVSDQRAWIVYRNSACEHDSDPVTCIQKYTDDRIAILQSLIAKNIPPQNGVDLTPKSDVIVDNNQQNLPPLPKEIHIDNPKPEPKEDVVIPKETEKEHEDREKNTALLGYYNKFGDNMDHQDIENQAVIPSTSSNHGGSIIIKLFNDLTKGFHDGVISNLYARSSYRRSFIERCTGNANATLIKKGMNPNNKIIASKIDDMCGCIYEKTRDALLQSNKYITTIDEDAVIKKGCVD